MAKKARVVFALLLIISILNLIFLWSGQNKIDNESLFGRVFLICAFFIFPLLLAFSIVGLISAYTEEKFVRRFIWWGFSIGMLLGFLAFFPVTGLSFVLSWILILIYPLIKISGISGDGGMIFFLFIPYLYGITGGILAFLYPKSFSNAEHGIIDYPRLDFNHPQP